MTVFEKIDLRALGEQQPVDTDYPLIDIHSGSLLLLNQRPQAYPWETHKAPEHILVVDGEIGIMSEDGAELTAYQGEMIAIPAGLRHAYHPDSNGVVVVLFGGQTIQKESTPCV